MNKTIKTVAMVLLFVMVLSVSTSAFATVAGLNITPDTNQQNVITAGNKILGVIKVIGIIASVAILMIVGIRYMMGSAEEKAQYKKVMIPYIIGAVLLFAASTIVDKLSTVKLF